MKYSAKVPKRKLFYAYLKTTNGLSELTTQELKVLAEFMWYHLSCIEKDAYTIPGMSLFNTAIRREVYTNLGLTPQNLTNIILALKKKGMLLEEGRKDIILNKNLDKFVKKVKDNDVVSITFEFNVA
jgi:hypothetical protein